MRLFLIDNQPIFREGLKSVIKAEHDLNVVGEAESCRDMLESAPDADLVILDGEPDTINLLNSFQKARSERRRPFVLVLTKHDEEHHAVQMLKAGADGYLYKSASPSALLSAIRKISRGGKYVANEVAETMIFALNGLNGPSRLSNREYQVLHLFASGMNMSEIAGHLSLSVKTVSTYRSRLLEKLNLKTNAQLMRYAFKEGMAQ
jgi:two-component system, NarL family, invasion response regulator UvrY